jgi:hypothetical protein
MSLRPERDFFLVTILLLLIDEKKRIKAWRARAKASTQQGENDIARKR